MRAILLVPLVSLSACKGPDPAPTELEDLIGWMFAHHGDEDTALLGEGATNLAVWMDDHLDETLEGYEVEVLTDAQIDPLDVGKRALDGLTGAAVGYDHVIGLGDVAEGLMVDPTEAHPDLYIEFEMKMLEGSQECFASGTCDWVEYTSVALEQLPLGIELDISAQLQFRRFDTSEGEAIAYRYWTTEPPTVTTDLFSLDQSYFYWAFVPHDGTLRSMQASWVVARVLADDLDSDIVMNFWVDGMVRGAGELDAQFEETE